MKKKGLVVLAHLLLGLVLLVSCTTAATPTSSGSQSTPSSAASLPNSGPTAGSAPVEIRWLYRIPSTPTDVFQWMAQTFNKEHEGKIHVTAYGVDDESYRTKFSVEMRSSNPPDVYFMWEGGQAKEVVDNGFAAPLDDYYLKYGWDKQLVPAALNLAAIEGHKYFVATEMQASVVWYRPDIFAKYNLQVPKTWDELTTVANTLKEHGIAPFMLANQMRWPAQFDWSAIYVNTYGVQAYNDLIDNKISWTDQKVVDTFAKIKWMVDNGWFHQNPNSLDTLPAVTPFCKGEAAMWYQGTFLLSGLHGDKAPGFLCPVDFFPYPQIGNQQPTVSAYAEETVMINGSSRNKEAAAELVNFIISHEAQQYKAGFRPFASVLNIDYSKLSPVEQKIPALMATSGGFTFMHPDHALPNTIADPFLDALQAVVGGTMTPEQAAAQVEKVATSVRGPIKS